MATAFEQSVRNIIDNAAANGVPGAVRVKVAFDAALAATAAAPSAAPTCDCAAPQVGYNKFRTLLKEDAPGFTNESLTAVLHSEGSRDVIVVHACNKFREMHEVFTLKVRDGMRVDRATVKAQIKLGVLKVTGRTYLSATPLSSMDLTDKAIPVTMA